MNLTEAAREYIRERGGEVWLGEPSSASMCCGRMEVEPDVFLKPPKESPAGGYRQGLLDGIKVNYPAKLDVSSLTITLENLLVTKRLIVRGFRYL